MTISETLRFYLLFGAVVSSEVMLLEFADNPESELPRVLGDMAASVRELSGLVLEMSEV